LIAKRTVLQMDCRKKEIAKKLVAELLSHKASEEREDEIIEELGKILPDPEFMDYIFIQMCL